MFESLPLIAATLTAVVAPAAPAAPDWLTDFAAAKAEAMRTGRDILIEFTGSDWCGWCIRLHDETLSTDRFAAWAGPRFVLLQLDYPRDTTAMAPQLIEQNAELRTRYAPSGFPTIVLADADGMPYARLVGYKPQDAWFEAIQSIVPRKRQRDEALQRAAGLEGRDRAAALRAALDTLDAADARAYTSLITEIHQLEFPQAEGAGADVALQHYLRTRSDAAEDANQQGAVEQPVQPALALRPAAGAPAVEHNMQEFRAIVEQLGGFAGRAGPDITTREFQLGVARALAYRYRVGEWPAGAGGNRAVLALMAWAESQSDLALFEALLREMPQIRRNLGGNEQFIGRLEGRLESLRAGTAEDSFYEWLLSRPAAPR